MGCTVSELLARISAKELTEWLAFDQLEPFGPRAVNLNAGIVTSGYLNCHKKKGTKQIRPNEMALGDFETGDDSSRAERRSGKQTVEEQKQMVLGIAYTFRPKKGMQPKQPKQPKQLEQPKQRLV